MPDQNSIDFQRIEKAIHFISLNFKSQPSLAEIARAVHVSDFHFQRMFSEWAGVSPKKFLQFISLNHARHLLRNRMTLLDTSYEVGLSGPGRLHDLFVSIEGMTPGEYKDGGSNLAIKYSFDDSPFGRILVASTKRGVCHLEFYQSDKDAVTALKCRFPNAQYFEDHDRLQEHALAIFHADWQQLEHVKLHLSGTPFQLKVWEALLKIPFGTLSTYGDIAGQIGNTRSSRAVGSAIGKNPIAFLIPCHRVIQWSGNLGGYAWGKDRKSAIIGWEAAKIEESTPGSA